MKTYSQELDVWTGNIFEVNEDVFGQELSFLDSPFVGLISHNLNHILSHIIWPYIG